MNVAVDIDGTVDAFPQDFNSLCAALRAAGHHVYVITGIESDTVTQQDVVDTQGYLTSIGITAYDTLWVTPTPHDEHKAKLIQDNDVAMLFDNDKDNCKAASSYCAALLLWNNKQ